MKVELGSWIPPESFKETYISEIWLRGNEPVVQGRWGPSSRRLGTVPGSSVWLLEGDLLQQIQLKA